MNSLAKTELWKKPYFKRTQMHDIVWDHWIFLSKTLPLPNAYFHPLHLTFSNIFLFFHLISRSSVISPNSSEAVVPLQVLPCWGSQWEQHESHHISYQIHPKAKWKKVSLTETIQIFYIFSINNFWIPCYTHFFFFLLHFCIRLVLHNVSNEPPQRQSAFLFLLAF